MKYYDLTYLITSDLSESEANELSQQIISSLQDKGAILQTTKTPQRRELAYPIKEKRSAYLGVVTFYLKDPAHSEDIRQELENTEQILRLLLLQPDEPGAGEEKEKKVSRTEEEHAGGKREKVQLEDVDKRLEEIL